MSDDQIKALWARTDEHGRAIHEITAEQRIMASQILAHDQRFERFLKEASDSRAEILTKLDSNQAKTEQVLESRWKASGAWELVYKGLPIMIAAIAVLVAVKW